MFEEDKKLYWYNFATEEFDYIEFPKNPREYIPQTCASLALYDLHVAMGKTPEEAMTEVLIVITRNKLPREDN